MLILNITSQHYDLRNFDCRNFQRRASMLEISVLQSDTENHGNDKSVRTEDATVRIDKYLRSSAHCAWNVNEI